MKKFLELSKPSLIVACVASILFCVDALIAPHIVAGSTFMWVAFISWTVTGGLLLKDKIRALIGCVIGFLFAVGMIYFGQLFNTSFLGIGIASLLGVFIFNGLVMYFENFKKFWMDSLTGIFMGIALTFSGLGVGLGPNTWANTGILFGTLMLYVVLGIICGFVSNILIINWKSTKKYSVDDKK